MLLNYKETYSFSSFLCKANSQNDDLNDGQSEKIINDVENALCIFFTSKLPVDSINQVNIIVSSLKHNNIDFKTFIFSFDFIPRIVWLTNSFNFLNASKKDFTNLFPILKLIDAIVSNNPELKNPDILHFCFSFLDFYFQQNLFPKFLESVHFLMKCFLNHICFENMNLFDEHFFDRISRFIIYDEQIHCDIAQIALKISKLLTEISRKYQYYFEFLQYLIKSSNQVTSFPLALSLKNIILKKPYFDSNENSWAYNAIIDFATSYDDKTQAIAFEICGILGDKDVLTSIMTKQQIKNSIKSIISQSNLSDVRLIPVIHALSHFLKKDPLNCSKTYITKERSEKLSPRFVECVLNGPFELKVDAGFLLAKSMSLNAFAFMFGLSDSLSSLYQSKIGDLKAAILEVLEIENEENQQLLISMLEALHIVCQECVKQSCIKKIQSEFAESGIFDRIDELRIYSDSEVVSSLCRMIFDCFEIEIK